MTETERLRVFLCHASNDKERVKKYYDHMVRDGIDAWLDTEKLLPGQRWNDEIQSAIKSSHAFIVFLTNNSVSKEGYVQKELRIALECELEKPEGSIFIIPAKLEECGVPARLASFQWVALNISDGYEKLLKSLRQREKQVGIRAPGKSEIIEYPLEKGVTLPEGTAVYYTDQTVMYPALGEFMRETIELKRESGNWLSKMELQHISVGGTFSVRFILQTLSKLLHDYPQIQIEIQYLMVDPVYLSTIQLSKANRDWTQSAEQSQKEIKHFIQMSGAKCGTRLDFSLRLFKGLPERSGTLLDHQHLFVTDVDYVHSDTQYSEMLVGQNTFAYLSIRNAGGRKQVELFQNRFKFYWDYLSIQP